MKLTELKIKGAWLAESDLHSDSRGNFSEWFKKSEIASRTGFVFEAAQANISTSHKGVLRGIHYSLADVGQAKWVTCVSGSVLDAIVDIREGSPTYGKYEIINLESKSGKSVLIGPGLGHGFIALEDSSSVAYLLSSQYSPADEYEINPFDSEIRIDWGVELAEAILSEKDKKAPSLETQKAIGKLPKY
jgi:dTDP-4-dehydrorhamnose 3,5-epimerase